MGGLAIQGEVEGCAPPSSRRMSGDGSMNHQLLRDLYERRWEYEPPTASRSLLQAFREPFGAQNDYLGSCRHPAGMHRNGPSATCHCMHDYEKKMVRFLELCVSSLRSKELIEAMLAATAAAAVAAVAAAADA